MGRSLLLGIAAAALVACDEPVGPQPDKPIRPTDAIGSGPPPGPPPPKPAPPKPVEPAVEAPPPVPEPPAPEKPKCPADAGDALTGKAKSTKDKKKRIELKLSGKANGPTMEFRKIRLIEEGGAEDVKYGAELTAMVATEPKGKLKMSVVVLCGWEDRVINVTMDPKSLQVTMKEAPPQTEHGFLNVVADPGMKVTASGKELGYTPLRNLPMAPGKYALKLEPKKGKAKTFAVEIKPQQVSTVAYDEKKKR
ncbi:MAG: hypothetical protein JNK82_04245 [Myxococcaceae bacterium]|nr:hypothetical protein [Myxococcaceae bacterium]